MQTELLIKEIKASGMNVEKFANELGISESTVYRKLKSGKFLVREAEKAAKILKLNQELAHRIFFT